MSKMKDLWAEQNGVYDRLTPLEWNSINNRKKDKERTSGNKRLNKKI